MRQTIRQLLMFPIGFCIVSTLFEPTNVPIPSAFAAAGDPSVTTTSPTPKSRLMSGMPALKRLATPPHPIPAIALNSLGLSFTSQQGSPPPSPHVLIVSNRGRGTLNWNATTNTSWLILSPASGTGNGTVTISLASGSLEVGTHTGLVTVNAPGAQPVSVPITLTVTAAPVPPAIGVTSPSLSFTAQQGGSNPAAQPLSIRNTGGGTLSWTARDNVAWLTLSPAAGTGNGTVTITPVLGSLGVGTHTGIITLSAPGAQPVSVPITFVVTPAPISITLSPSSLTYTGVSGGSNPANQSVTVTANGNWTASVNAPWLKLSTTSGSGNGTIIARVDLGSVSAKTNTASLSVTAGNTTRTLGVTLTLSDGSLTLSSNSLAFTATQGLANPSSKTITVQSAGSWTATKAAPWLVLSQTSGSANGTITANVDTSKATQGENQATITVASGSIIKTVTITLTLNAPSSSSATLTWKANSETDLAGYKVYRSTVPGKYEQSNLIALLPKNMTTYQATGLQSRTTYFFVVTAFDIAGNESGYSNEVSKSVY